MKKTIKLFFVFFLINIGSILYAQDYCIPSFMYDCSADGRITKVHLEGESIVLSNDSQCSENSYGDYTDITSPDLAPGETYYIEIQTDSETPSDKDVRAWIDYDSNGTFDMLEEIANTNGGGMGEGIVGFNFTIPPTITPGNYRLRVLLAYNGGDSISPCGNEVFGEAEDYDIQIIELEDCSGIPSIGVIENDSFDVCEAEPFTLTISSDYEPGNGLEHIWQSSPVDMNDWSDIDGAISNVLVVEDGITSSTDYRYRITCSYSDQTVYSDVIKVSLNLSDICTYCIPFNNNSDYTYITNFKTEDALVNIDNSSVFSENGYGDYTETDTIVGYPGQEIKVSISTAGMSFRYVWIDWNNDKVFDEVEENVIATDYELSPYLDSFIIPDTISVGTITRLRVRNSIYDVPTACGEMQQGEAEDYTLKIVALDNCEEGISAGFSDDSSFEICAENSFTLSVTGASGPANGLTRVWQSSPLDENDWIDIEGQHLDYYDVLEGITEPTKFRYKVSCEFSDETDYSEEVEITITPQIDCHCIPTYNHACTPQNKHRISNVRLFGESVLLNNDSYCDDGSYSDFTDLTPVDFLKGEDYSIQISTSSGHPQSEEVRIWIDYNDNGVFEDSEEIGNTLGNGMSSTGSETFDFTVPSDVELGSHRMRVRLEYSSSGNPAVDPCENLNYGEAEDYFIEIIEVEECSGTPNAGTLEENFSICADESFFLTVTDSSPPAIGLHRVWQSSPAGEDNWTDIEGFNSNGLIVEDGITEPTDFRFKISCANSDGYEISDLIEVSLNDPTECYCIPLNEMSQDYFISHFSTEGALINISNDSEFSEGGYADYTETSGGMITAYPGQEITVNVSSNSHIQMKAWADWNLNGDFSDVGENIIMPPFPGIIWETYTDSFVVPEWVPIGTVTRLRVRIGWKGMPDPCDLTEDGETEDYLIKIIANPTCLPPNDISYSNITTESAQVNWTLGGNETQWQLTYGETNFDPYGEEVPLIDVEGTPQTTITGLNANQSYDIYIKAICDDEDGESLFYGPNTLTTACDFTTPPFLQNFETVTIPELPVCSTLETISGNSWKTVSNVYGFDGNLLVNQENLYGEPANTWFFTQGVYLEAGVNYQISYKYGNSVSGTTEKLKVAYGTFPQQSSMGTIIADHNNIYNSEVSESLILFTVSEDNVYYFGFNSYSDTIQGNLYLDDIEVDYGPICPKPTGIEVTYITDSSAIVNWDIWSNESQWVLTFGTEGFDLEEEGTTIHIIDEDPMAHLTSLEPNVTYDIYINVICSEEEESVFAGPVSFTTNVIPPENTYLCAPINLELNADCELGPFTNVDAFEENYEIYGSCLNVFSGKQTVWFTFEAPSNGEVIINTDYLDNNFNIEYTVYEAPTDCQDMSSLGLEVGCKESDSEDLFIDGLMPFEAYYIQVAGFNDAVGDFCIDVQTSADYCLDPVNVEVYTIEDTSIYVSWEASGNESEWEVIYDEAGFDPAISGNTEVVLTPEILFTELTPYTQYEMYVRAICDAENISNMVGPIAFHIEDMSVNINHTTGFAYYPNPVQGLLYIESNNMIESIKIHNLLGQNLINTSPNALETQINLKKLQNGVYFMKVTINGIESQYKIIKY